MQWNSNTGRSLLVLLGVAALILLPITISGYIQRNIAGQMQHINDHNAAFKSYKLAAQRLPWHSELWEQAGIEALKAGLGQDAIDMLERAHGLSPQGWVALGDAYQQKGQSDLALAAYQSALQIQASADVYRGMAGLYRSRGDLQSERSALENQLLLGTGDAAAHYRLGLLLCLSDINAALTHFQIAAQLDAEYEPVVDTLRSGLALAELSPSESGRLVTLGRAMGLVGEWPLAEVAFRQAVQADGTSALAWAWLGESKQHLGEGAAVEMDKALALDSQSAVVRGLRGLYWKRLGNERNALAEYQQAASADPQNPAWTASLAETYARLGDLVSALAAYQRAAQLAPDESMYWRLLAAFCLEYNVQIEEIGLPAAQQARQLSPEDALAADILGWSQLAAGDPQAARETLLDAIRIVPDYALAHYHLALSYLQTGERAAAREQLSLAIQLDPGGETGTQASQLLGQQFP